MDVDKPKASGSKTESGGELKIKGQAEVERKKSKWDEGKDDVRLCQTRVVEF